MNVLVTGSSGFIGRHLCAELLALGWQVTGLDLRPAPDAPWRTLPCDIRDAGALRLALEAGRPEYVAHLAARTDLEGRTLADYAANTDGVRNLLAAIDAAGTVRRCIFTSTQLIAAPGTRLAADDAYAPTTPYGESKALGEEIVRGWASAVEWCVVRPTTIWGPGMNEHYRRFFRHLQRGTYFHVGREPLWKSYGYVGNTAYQYRRLLAADSDRMARRTFYLADYAPLSLREWTEQLARALGARPIRTLPRPAARLLALVGDALVAAGWSRFPITSFRLGNILTGYTVDTSDLEAITGPLPYDQAAGVQATAAWLRETALRRAAA